MSKKIKIGMMGNMSMRKLKIYFDQGNSREIKNRTCAGFYKEARKIIWEEFKFLSKKIEKIIFICNDNHDHQKNKICLLCSVKFIIEKMSDKDVVVRNKYFGLPVMDLQWWPYDNLKIMEVVNSRQEPIKYLSRLILVQIIKNKKENKYWDEVYLKLILY